MPFEAVDYITLDGFRYAFNNFKRFSIPTELPQIEAIKVQPPYIDFETQSFDGGMTAAAGGATANYYRDAVALEQVSTIDGDVERPYLQTGRALVPVGTTGATVLTRSRAAINWRQGQLYLGAATSAGVYKYNGTSWALIDTLATGTITAFAQYRDRLVAMLSGTADWEWTTATGVAAFTPIALTTGGGGCWAVTETAVPFGSTGGVLYRIVDLDNNVEGNGRAGLRRFTPDSSVETVCGFLEEGWSRSPIIQDDGGTIYITGAAFSAEPFSAQIYKYAGQAASGSLVPIARMNGDIFSAAAYFRGTPYFGTKLRPQLYRYANNGLELVKSFPFYAATDGDPTWSLYVDNDRLLAAGVYDDVGQNSIRIYSFDGEAWSQPYTQEAFTSNIFAAGPMALAPAGVGHKLVVAAVTNTTGGFAFEVSTATYSAVSQLQMADVVYGSPTVQKSYVHGRIQHSALLSGQSVRLTHRLDGSTVETTDGTNVGVGSKETVIPFPVETVGSRLHPRWYLNAASATGGSTKSITVYSAGVRAAPLPVEREVWTADLVLTNNQWNDGTSDSRDALEKYERLVELKRGGRTFQAIDPFRESSATTLPRAAMMAKIDAQLPLEWDAQQLASNAGGAYISVPIRFSQVYGDVVGPSNLDFENDAAGATAITGWTYSATTSSGSASISTAVNTFRTGSKSVALTFSGTPTLFNISQTITGLTGGRYYTVGGYLKRQMSAGVACIEVSSTGLGVRTDEIASATDAEFDWYERTFQLPVANSAITVRVGATGTPAGTLWLDGVRCIE